MLDSVPEPNFSICASKWSLLTSKKLTSGHKNVAFSLTLQGGLRAQVKYIRKTIGTLELWS